MNAMNADDLRRARLDEELEIDSLIRDVIEELAAKEKYRPGAHQEIWERLKAKKEKFFAQEDKRQLSLDMDRS